MNLSFPLHPFVNAATVGSWAYVADNHIRNTNEGGDRTTSGPSRYVQGLHAYVQGFTLKACRHVLRRVISPGHPWRLITVIGAPTKIYEGDLAMSKKGIKGGSASNTLYFHDTELSIIDHDGQLWLTGVQIEAALGFTKAGGVSQLYRRNRDEFSDDMVAIIRQGRTRIRIFNARGCHLIAMFANTDRAKEFRRWALDVLDHLKTKKPEQRSLARGCRYLMWFDDKGESHTKAISDDACIVDGGDRTNLCTFLREFVPNRNLPAVFDLVTHRMRFLACRALGKKCNEKGAHHVKHYTV